MVKKKLVETKEFQDSFRKQKQNKTEIVRFCVTPDERAAIIRASKVVGTDISGYLLGLHKYATSTGG